VTSSYTYVMCHICDLNNESVRKLNRDCEQWVQGGEDPLDALSCRSFFAQEPLIIGLFCGK